MISRFFFFFWAKFRHFMLLIHMDFAPNTLKQQNKRGTDGVSSATEEKKERDTYPTIVDIFYLYLY